MTDNEIIKALECCCGTAHDSCRDCPYDDIGCEDKLEKDALDLINRQKAENEELKLELKSMRGAANSYKMHYENAQAEVEKFKKIDRLAQKTIDLQTAEIKKLEAEVERLENERIERIRELTKVVYDKEIAEAKADAIKEFAERLKPMMFGYYDCLEQSAKGRPYKGDTLMDYEVVDMVEDCIDNLVKEMVGD